MARAKATGRDRRRRGQAPESRKGLIKKVVWKPGAMLCPVPVVMVTCAGKDRPPNIVTVAWTGTVCSDPPMLSISLRKERYSFGLIKETGEFVVNIPPAALIPLADYCGVATGREVDKFAATGLTPQPAATVKSPLIAECPVNIECVVRRLLDLGSHTMFLAEVTAVQATEALVTPSGRLALERAGLAAYAHGGYYALGKKLGYFGFSVCKRKGPKKQ